MLKFGSSTAKAFSEPEQKPVTGKLRMAISARDLDDDEPLVVRGAHNEFVEVCRKWPITRLVEIWKIGFGRFKRGVLTGDNIKRYEAVKFVLSSFYKVNLPKDGR